MSEKPEIKNVSGQSEKEGDASCKPYVSCNPTSCDPDQNCSPCKPDDCDPCDPDECWPLCHPQPDGAKKDK